MGEYRMKPVYKLSMLVLALALVTGGAIGEQVTFTKDVLPILQANCQDCHRPSGKNMSGMVAPMSFMSYEEVRPWAKAIVKAVEAKQMPPWHAAPEFHGKFRNERALSEQEIATLVSWVQQNAPRGNPQDAPAPIEWHDGWYMGEPDLILRATEPFFVKDDIVDLYHNLPLDVPVGALSEDKWVKQIEFRPGSEVVHHIIAYGVKQGAEGDENFRNRTHLGGLAPGTDPADYPEGYGKLLPADSRIILQMHYHKESGPGTGRYDNSEMALKFHDRPVSHEVTTSAVSYGPFEIPPFHPNWKVGGARIFEEDIDLLNLMPHTHLRGTHAKYTAFYPDGSTEVLLEVPEYDFNWQTSYSFTEIKKIPAGTRIEWEVWYDNTQERAEMAGFNPAEAVSFGQPTTAEMDLGWMSYSPSKGGRAQSGD
jgi:mono/diheme cytochrome c family protein